MTEYGRIHTDGSRSGGQPALKPCPFCGGQAVIVEFESAGLPWWMGEGQEPSCDAAGPAFATKAEAIAAYNTRQPTQSDVSFRELAAVLYRKSAEFQVGLTVADSYTLAAEAIAFLQEQSK